MLAMIHPIGPIPSIQASKPVDVANGLPPPVFGDTMVFAKKNGLFLTVLVKIWTWIKYHILFLFFDEGEDRKKRLGTDLKNFWDHFEAMTGSEAGSESVKKQFKKLDSELQKIIEEQIVQVFKEASPRMADKDLQAKMKEVLNDPFKKNNQDQYIILLALAKATQKIAEY